MNEKAEAMKFTDEPLNQKAEVILLEQSVWFIFTLVSSNLVTDHQLWKGACDISYTDLCVFLSSHLNSNT